MPIASNFVVKVVGLTFADGYPDNIYALNDLASSRGLMDDDMFEEEGSPIAAFLVRQPNNPVDPNAIEVHVADLPGSETKIGHIPAGVASKLAPSIDNGDEWNAQVEFVAIHPAHPENPGISLRVSRPSATGSEPF